MAATVTQGRDAGLERSCADCGRDWIKIRSSRPGFERIEACFSGHAFAPHRHDTYAIGLTVTGVQSFGYRGGEAHSLPGHAFVIHPDELHDGHAGTAQGFQYRILYVEPHLIQEALGGRHVALPFVRDAVTDNARLCAAIAAALADGDAPVEDLQRDHSLVRLADALAMQDRSAPPARAGVPDLRAARTAREFLDANILEPVASAALERLTGVTRFTLARHFRACFGTSPHRYVVLRRLDRVRQLLNGGSSLAAAALDSGFADQSHMTRHFKKAYGLSPGQWSRMVRPLEIDRRSAT